MSEQVYGLNKAGIDRTAETNRRVLGTLPSTGETKGTVSPPQRRFPVNQNDQVWVRNDSQFELARYAVVGFDEAIIPPVGGHEESLLYLDDPIFSIRPPEGCRHRGRFAVLTQTLKPGEYGKAIVSSSFIVYLDLDQWPSRDPVYVDVDEALTGAEYHTTVYGNRQRPVLKQDPDGSAQVIHAGRDWFTDGVVRTCTGTIDIECEPGGTEWNITRDSCEEGCGGRFAGNIPATPCTPGDEVFDLPCRTGSTAGYVGTVRMGNAKIANPEDCGCRADACRSTCRQTDCDGDCEYVSVFDAGSPTSYAWSLSSNTCTLHCGCRSAAALAADVGYPTVGATGSESCQADGTGWHWYITSNGCRGDTRLETTTTTADPLISTTSSSSTTSTSAGITTTTAGPECVCPDLNILRATWPELYPCGASEAVKEQTHFCYTTTTTTSTTTTSTSTSTSTTSTSTSTSSSTSSSTSTSTSTTVPPTTTTTTALPCTVYECGVTCYRYSGAGPCEGVAIIYSNCPSGIPGCGCVGSAAWLAADAACQAISPCTFTNTTIYCDVVLSTTTGAPTTSSSAAPTSSTTTADPTTTTSGGPTSTTTAEPTTTTSGGMTSTTTGDPTTTTSAAPSSTTTTAPPNCNTLTCMYVCNGSSWGLTTDGCTGFGCVCPDSGVMCGACGAGENGTSCGGSCTS